MKTSKKSSLCSVFCKTALLALGCAFGLALVPSPSLKAADTAMAEKMQCVPLTATFAKVADAEKAPYVLTLKNDSKDTIKASAKVLLAVAFHAEAKARTIPELVIEAGKSGTIADLAAGDKVVVSAAGFCPLELTVK